MERKSPRSPRRSPRSQNIRFQPQKERIYCGKSGILPPGYDRFGTPFECLRKGYGAGIHAPEYRRREAIQRSEMEGYRILSYEELMDQAAVLGINTVWPNGQYKTRLELLNEMMPVMLAIREELRRREEELRRRRR